jgi:hypothetical protein
VQLKLERHVPSSPEILIGDTGGQYVLIRALSRSQPDLFELRDGDWIDCEVALTVGGFNGSFRADLRSEEFRSFLEEAQALAQAPDGSASFTTMEGQVAISLTGDDQGRLRVSGEAIDEAGAGNRLQFAFVIDQAYLSSIIEALENLLIAYPVAGTADIEKIEEA